MRILGISALYHDSAAAIVADGNIIAAAQEERFSRKKHDPGRRTAVLPVSTPSFSTTSRF
jgi:predicted NodU family carbamoyl transferase